MQAVRAEAAAQVAEFQERGTLMHQQVPEVTTVFAEVTDNDSESATLLRALSMTYTVRHYQVIRHGKELIFN